MMEEVEKIVQNVSQKGMISDEELDAKKLKREDFNNQDETTTRLLQKFSKRR
jgi:hypothetical protein